MSIGYISTSPQTSIQPAVCVGYLSALRCTTVHDAHMIETRIQSQHISDNVCTTKGVLILPTFIVETNSTWDFKRNLN